MKLQQYLNERDVASLDTEKCTNLKGIEKIKCKVDMYRKYIADLKKAIMSSETEEEEDRLEASLKSAKDAIMELSGKI